MAVEMVLARILIRETSDTHVVELREVDGPRVFAIEIGLFEAAAIERRLRGDAPPRPQTHELLSQVIEAFDARIDRVLINDFRAGVFYARLFIRQGDRELDIDARPSDAIALGVRTQVPIYVAEQVLDQVSTSSEP